MIGKPFYVAFLVTMIVITISSNVSYSETDSEVNQIEQNSIFSDPFSQKLLKNIEISKKQIADILEKEKQRDEQKDTLIEQRTIAQATLDQDLKVNEKTYEEFTPVNAYKKFVSGVNATHQAIYMDQFAYFNTKIMLAKDARDSVLANGGTYNQAMLEYAKYAMMPRVEMINVIANLNIKHEFTDSKTQAYFDVNAKLPRYENDLDAPCYGCSSTITKVKTSPTETKVMTEVNLEPKVSTSIDLKAKLSSLQAELMVSKYKYQQQAIMKEMHVVIKQMQELKNS